MFAEDISEDFSEDRRYHFTGFYSISGYLRNLRGRLLSSEKPVYAGKLWADFSFPTYKGKGEQSKEQQRKTRRRSEANQKNE